MFGALGGLDQTDHLSPWPLALSLQPSEMSPCVFLPQGLCVSSVFYMEPKHTLLFPFSGRHLLSSMGATKMSSFQRCISLPPGPPGFKLGSPVSFSPAGGMPVSFTLSSSPLCFLWFVSSCPMFHRHRCHICSVLCAPSSSEPGTKTVLSPFS